MLTADPNRRNQVNRAGSIDQQLRFAIGHKLLLQVIYTDATRVVEPHDYGTQKKGLKLLVYQVRRIGGGSGKDGSGWRLLDVGKIQACVVLEETFPGSRGDSHQQHYKWDDLYARVG